MNLILSKFPLPLQQDYNLYKGFSLHIYFGWSMNIIKSQNTMWIEMRCYNIQLKKECSVFIFPHISFLLLTKVTELQANKYTWNMTSLLISLLVGQKLTHKLLCMIQWLDHVFFLVLKINGRINQYIIGLFHT